MQRNTPRMPWRRNYVFLCQFYPLQTIFQFTEDRKLITDISSKFQQLWGFKVLKNKQGGRDINSRPALLCHCKPQVSYWVKPWLMPLQIPTVQG